MISIARTQGGGWISYLKALQEVLFQKSVVETNGE